ncbi:hypothetical protein Tco_0246694 [Tanacetum coccineum]
MSFRYTSSQNHLSWDAEEWEYSLIPIPAPRDISNPDELCKTEEFIVIKYSMGSSEEFVTVSPSKVSTVERTPGSMSCVDGVFDGAFGGEGEEDVVMGEGVVVTSSSLEMLTNSCLGEIMVSLILLEGLEEEA